MTMEITSNYNNVYENTYAAQKQQAAKKEEIKETSAAKAKTTNYSSNEGYLKSLQKQVPYMKLQIGNGINTRNDGKVNIVDVNPKLLEKMQNDPEAAKEYTQRLKDVEAALKFGDNFSKSMGHTVVCSHGYIDENGKFSYFAVVVKKDLSNEKLRKEAQENAEKQIEKSREYARKKTEQLAEQLEEKAEEAKESEKKQEKTDSGAAETDTVKDKAEMLFSEKIESAKDGKVLLDDEDMQMIIEAVKADNQGKAVTKKPVAAGTNFDMQV